MVTHQLRLSTDPSRPCLFECRDADHSAGRGCPLSAPQTGSCVTDARSPPHPTLGASLQAELGIQNPTWGPGHLVPRATGQHRDPLQGWKPDAEAPARIKSQQEPCPQDADHRPGTRGARPGQPEWGHRGPPRPLGDWTLVELQSEQHAAPQCKGDSRPGICRPGCPPQHTLPTSGKPE